MRRFIVTRQYVKFKGKLYNKGELLPPEFTERDRCRNIYPSRIGTVEIEEKTEENSAPMQGLSQGTNSGVKPLSSNTPITGTKPANINTATKANTVARANTSK